MLNKFDYYINAFRNYANFKGRANKSQFWYFILFNVIVFIIISLTRNPLLYILYIFALLTPTLSLVARRMHDVGKSGVLEITLLGIILFLIPVSLMVLLSLPSLNLGLMVFPLVFIVGGTINISSIIYLSMQLSKPSDTLENKYGKPVMVNNHIASLEKKELSTNKQVELDIESDLIKNK